MSPPHKTFFYSISTLGKRAKSHRTAFRYAMAFEAVPILFFRTKKPCEAYAPHSSDTYIWNYM